MPRRSAAARAKPAPPPEEPEELEEEEDEDDGEELDEEEDEDAEEDGDEEEDEGDDEDVSEQGDAAELAEEEPEIEVEDVVAPHPEATHYKLFRKTRTASGVWLNDGEGLWFGVDKKSGARISSWPLSQCTLEEIQARFGPGAYQPFWLAVKENGRFRPLGFGRVFELENPAVHGDERSSAAAPQLDVRLPPPQPITPPPPYTPTTDLTGWDIITAQGAALLSDDERRFFAGLRFLDDNSERKARVMIEGERLRCQQHLEAMAMQNRATLEIVLALLTKAPLPGSSPAALPATPAAAAAAPLFPDLAGLAKMISQLQGLGQQLAGTAPVVVESGEPAAPPTPLQQLLVIGAQVAPTLLEILKTTVQANAAAKAAAASETTVAP